MPNESDQEAEEIFRGWKELEGKVFIEELMPAEKRQFAKARAMEKINRLYPLNFRTCGPGCPGLYRQKRPLI